MSIDNGTYILQTKGEEGPSFRVAYTHAIDNIYGAWNEETQKWRGDGESFLLIFGESAVINNLVDAWDAAMQLDLDKTGNYSEYGACLITEFADRTFNELTESA